MIFDNKLFKKSDSIWKINQTWINDWGSEPVMRNVFVLEAIKNENKPIYRKISFFHKHFVFLLK